MRSNRWLAAYTALVYLFLYAPVIVMVLYSFNRDPRNAVWRGFTFSWYATLWGDLEIRRALWNSLQVGVIATLVATTLGTMAALALTRYHFRLRGALSGLVYLPMVVPEVVMGTSLLSFLAAIGWKLSLSTIIVSHIAFCVSYVTITVRARLAGMDFRLEEAAADLGAGPWDTFRLVTLPRILPGVISGALLCLTISIDDFVVTFFTQGVGSGTLPIRIYSMVKTGITPEINAVSSLMLLTTFCLMMIYGRLGRGQEPSGARGT